jgi:hypothetical protein
MRKDREGAEQRRPFYCNSRRPDVETYTPVRAAFGFSSNGSFIAVRRHRSVIFCDARLFVLPPWPRNTASLDWLIDPGGNGAAPPVILDAVLHMGTGRMYSPSDWMSIALRPPLRRHLQVHHPPPRHETLRRCSCRENPSVEYKRRG